MRPFVPKGWTGRLLIVGEAPGADEDELSGRPFTGAAGKLLRTLWREAGYDDLDVALANSVRCRPRKNATPSMRQVRACRAFTVRVIEQLKPRSVLGVGTTALRSLSNQGTGSVTDNRGRQITVPGVSNESHPRVWCTYHPAAVLRGAVHLREAIKSDLSRLGTDTLPGPTVAIPSGKALALDTEFGPDGTTLTVALANTKDSYAWETEWRDVSAVLGPVRRIVGHSVAQDISKLAQIVPVKETWIEGSDVLDSLLLARMVEENGQSYELENLLTSFASVEPWKKATKDLGFLATDWPVDLRMDRCRKDAWASALIAEHFAARLRDCWPLVVYTHKIASILERIQLAGAMVDVPRYQGFVDKIHAEKLQAEDMVMKAAGLHGMNDFSATNDSDIRELLFEKLGLTPPNRTTTGLPAVDKMTLKNLNNPIADLIVRFNKVEKMWSTYGPGIAEYYHPCGQVDGCPVAYLPFRINPLGARTGRRSSSRPNSQNWPKDFRPIIRSRFRGGSIGDFDYSKLEVILIAWVAKEDKLFQYFSKGNGYIDVAKEMWGFDVKEDTPEYRATKSIVLGVHYNMGSRKMARQLHNLGVRFSADYDEHYRKTDSLRRTYLKRFPRISVYMDEREREVLRTNQVVSLTGRVRHLPLPDGRDTEGYGHALNQGINFPIQSLASDVTGSALLDIELELLKLHGFSYRQWLEILLEWQKKVLTNPENCDKVSLDREIKFPVEMPVILNEVHDDIVVDLPEAKQKESVELVVETMRKVPSLRRLCPAFDVPLNVGVKIAGHWYGADKTV